MMPTDWDNKQNDIEDASLVFFKLLKWSPVFCNYAVVVQKMEAGIPQPQHKPISSLLHQLAMCVAFE